MALKRRAAPECETPRMKVVVVGHVEWVEFARVEHVPAAGEIVHASETWQEAAGGGPVTAGGLARPPARPAPVPRLWHPPAPPAPPGRATPPGGAPPAPPGRGSPAAAG